MKKVFKITLYKIISNLNNELIGIARKTRDDFNKIVYISILDNINIYYVKRDLRVEKIVSLTFI